MKVVGVEEAKIMTAVENMTEAEVMNGMVAMKDIANGKQES
jgi:hypothetical protein